MGAWLMGLLIALGTVLGVIVAGGAIWSWVWPRIKCALDDRRAEQEKLQQTLTNINYRLDYLAQAVDMLSKHQDQLGKILLDQSKTDIEQLERIINMDKRLSEVDSANGEMISLTADRVANLGDHVANMMEEMIRNRARPEDSDTAKE
jgi:hypothetical protein